jgi:pimeloyl-ACP methyl ester carboxylesterase
MPGANRVTSRDGTRIAFDRVGAGPPVILVDPAAHFRAFSAFEGLVRRLSRQFTAFTYDRRGRGESTDVLPYSPDREVDDLEALIDAAGGSAHVYGYSSGALLAMHAAARGVAITRLALLEPPLQEDGAEVPDPLTAQLAELVAAGRNADAVELFHRSIGVPSEVVADMRSTPAWSKMVSVAPTLVYDCMISDATTPALLGSIQVPTLVLDSEGSTDDLTGSAVRVAARLPHATHRSLPGEWHGVPDEVLAPVLIEFFRSGA